MVAKKKNTLVLPLLGGAAAGLSSVLAWWQFQKAEPQNPPPPPLPAKITPPSLPPPLPPAKITSPSLPQIQEMLGLVSTPISTLPRKERLRRQEANRQKKLRQLPQKLTKLLTKDITYLSPQEEEEEDKEESVITHIAYPFQWKPEMTPQQVYTKGTQMTPERLEAEEHKRILEEYEIFVEPEQERETQMTPQKAIRRTPSPETFIAPEQKAREADADAEAEEQKAEAKEREREREAKEQKAEAEEREREAGEAKIKKYEEHQEALAKTEAQRVAVIAQRREAAQEAEAERQRVAQERKDAEANQRKEAIARQQRETSQRQERKALEEKNERQRQQPKEKQKQEELEELRTRIAYKTQIIAEAQAKIEAEKNLQRRVYSRLKALVGDKRRPQGGLSPTQLAKHVDMIEDLGQEEKDLLREALLAARGPARDAVFARRSKSTLAEYQRIVNLENEDVQQARQRIQALEIPAPSFGFSSLLGSAWSLFQQVNK